MKNKSSKNVRGCSNDSSYSSSDNIYGNAKKILLIAALNCGLQLLWLYFRHFPIPDGDKDSLGPCLMWQCMIAIFSTVSYPRKKSQINDNKQQQQQQSKQFDNLSKKSTISFGILFEQRRGCLYQG